MGNCWKSGSIQELKNIWWRRREFWIWKWLRDKWMKKCTGNEWWVKRGQRGIETRNESGETTLSFSFSLPFFSFLFSICTFFVYVNKWMVNGKTKKKKSIIFLFSSMFAWGIALWHLEKVFWAWLSLFFTSNFWFAYFRPGFVAVSFHFFFMNKTVVSS